MRGTVSPCENIQCKYCNQNVHEIICQMLQSNYAASYIGELFDKTSLVYPVFQGDSCCQYLQEYVPFHLPQIEYVLDYVLNKFPRYLNMGNEAFYSVLDIGSGPATVPLAFCRLLPNPRYKTRLEITTLEASVNFNKMIKIFQETNTNSNIEIVESITDRFEYYMLHADDWRGRYNWIIIANFLSGIADVGQCKSSYDVSMILNALISKLIMPKQTIMLTFIEGGCEHYFKTREYLREVESIGFADLNIKNTVSDYSGRRRFANILTCKYYKTRYGNDTPHICAKTLQLELK